MDYARSFYCALVIERRIDGEGHCAVVRDRHGKPTDSDTACAAWFTVYRVDGEGLSHAVADFTERDEARKICSLLIDGLAYRGPASLI